MPKVHQTLLFQTVQNEHSLVINMSSFKEQSSKYNGLLSNTEVTLANVNFKFMPGSVNQLIKLLRSTRLKTQPMHGHDEENYEQMQLLEANGEANDDLLLAPIEQPPLEPDQIIEQVQKIYDSDCSKQKGQTSRISMKVEGIKMSMLHHKHTMELFSLDANTLAIEMQDWYDHSSFSCTMTALRLSDLTNHPYTYNPAKYYAAVSQNLEPDQVTPNEMIRCQQFEFSLSSYYGTCKLRQVGFNNRLVMRISPFRINFVQEVTMRFVEYFQQRFVDSLTMTDPYKNPKEDFELRQQKQGLTLEKITANTDLKQPLFVDYMDIQISKAQIFARDRPFSTNYILISSPLISVNSELVRAGKKFVGKPEIQVSLQRYCIKLATINFWYGVSKHKKERLSLLKKTFTISVQFDALLWSEVLDKIDVRQMDKATQVLVACEPVMLVLPQAVYTYLLRCSDLNFAWTDQLAAEFYFVKWIQMSEFYKQFHKVVAQRIKLAFPLLTLTLKHTDGSYIAELLLCQLDYSITRYLDSAQEQQVSCAQFYILGQQGQTKQAVVCPWNSPREVDSETLDLALQTETQLSISISMKASGNKDIQVNIAGLKIFLKMPLFILLQGYFLNAWPEYHTADRDKPVGFVGNDPDNSSRMSFQLKVHQSLICLLNQPGYKSIAMLGDFEFSTLQENIHQACNAYNSFGGARHNSISQSSNSDSIAPCDTVYSMRISVKGLSPYICSLSQLESGQVNFDSINKRQLFSPLDLSLEQTYQLTPETDEDLAETGKWGVTTRTNMQVGRLQLKLSILDLHLILQVTAYASEQMAQETVFRLQEIERSIDRQSEHPLQKSQFFDQLVTKFQESNTDSVATVMERLSQTTEQFRRLTKGYTGHSFTVRETFLQFVTQDILKQDINIQNLPASPQAPQMTELAESSDSDEFFDVTEERTSYFTLLKSERAKTIHQKQSQASSTPKVPSYKQKPKPQPEESEDEFHSARGSFESYREQVEAAVEMFYSFHEKRPLEDNPLFQGGEEDAASGGQIESIRETMADMRASGSIDTSEESSILDQSPKPLEPKAETVKVRGTMENILEDVKALYCEQISVLAINDYNCGFTPVLQLDMSRINMNQSSKGAQGEMGLVLPELLVNYYNLELGQWEPLLEPTQVILEQTTTQFDNKMVLTMKEPVNLNSTEECLKNLIFTYESWMRTPHYFTKPVPKKIKMINASNESKESDDEYSITNKNFISQMRESVVRPSNLAVSREPSMMFSNDTEQPEQKQANQQAVTPFSIANFTSRTIKVVRGGIKPGHFADVKNYVKEVSSKPENQQIYLLAPSAQTDYAVTYDRLMGQGNEQKEHNPEDDSMHQSEIEEQLRIRKQQKIKNNEMVGIQLSDLDYVAFVDLNRNTGQNPWVHEISPSVCHARISQQLDQIDNETPLLDQFEHISGDDLVYSQNRYRVFYGTILKGMRKFLVIRAPFCIVNKTAYPYEIRILDAHAKQIQHQQKLNIGETMGLDDLFYADHQLQVKLVKAEPLRGVKEEALWSQRVTISTLLKMNADLGTGIFLTSADNIVLSSCIKRQSGEINGTTDFALVAPITFKNFLPCSMIVRQRHSNEQYILEQSQEKQFHVFTTTKTDRLEEFQLDLGVDGFQFAALDLRVSQETGKLDEDFEIADLSGNTLKIGLKIQINKAGFHVTVYAHVVILLQTISVLPMLKVLYKSNFRERRPLANTEEIASRSYVLCNKDQDIVVGVKDRAGGLTYSYSVSLDLTKQTAFSVITAPGANAYQVNQMRFDFICTPTPYTLNFEDKVFTKIVEISPAYILCNLTDGDLEVAQSDNINAQAEQDRVLQAGQKREWYWPAGNIVDAELKIQIRSLGRPSDEENCEPIRDCRWSRPLSLYQIQDQILFPILLTEVQGTRKMILLISKKVVGPTTFITIRALKSQTPPYLIKNLCPNLRLSFQQDEQQTPYNWKLGENDSSPYAHLDPQSRTLNCTFNMTIDKSARRWQFKTHYCFERQLVSVSFERDFTEDITYQDIENKNRIIRVSVHNDGLTKCLTFRLIGESLKRENKLPKQQSAGIIRSTIMVNLQWLSISFVGYTQTIIPKDSWLKKGYQNRRERNEVALLTITGLSLTHTSNYENNSQATNLEIGKFQIDNQSSQNPLFPTILCKRDTSATAAPFLFFVLQQSYCPETNLRTIDFFDCSFAEYVLRLDDSFLVNVILTVLAAQAVNTSAQNSIHPLFLKDSFYGRNGFIQNYSPSKEPRRIKQDIGVVLASETRFNQKLDEVHESFCHWMMQDRWLEEQGKLELKQFKISKIVLEVTFIFRTKDASNKDEVSINFLRQSGLKLASIDELLLKFEPFAVQDRILAQHDFSACLNEFYFKNAYSQVIKSLLTIKLIGSLPNLVRHVGQGFFGLVDTPKRGFERNWAAGVGGIFIGFGILFKQSFVGLFGTTQVFSESWSELFLAVCMDNDYAIKHEEEVLTERPKNFVEGLGFGARSALQSIPDACLGLLTRPIIEASRGGAKGFMLGMWQGIAGVPCKLFSGGLDLFAKTSEGFKNTLRILEQKQKKGRVRMPRTFYGLQRRIKVFSEDDAFIVSNVLCQIKRGEFSKDHYVDMKLVRTASDTRAPHFLLLSEENLFLVEASQKALVWHVNQKHITKIQNMSNGLLINLKEDEDYAGRAQVGLPLDGQSSLEINEWFGQILSDEI